MRRAPAAAALAGLALAACGVAPAAALKQLPGRAGCVGGARTKACTVTPYDRGPSQPTTEMSGRFLYGIVPYRGVATVAGFAVGSNGALRALRGPTSCVRRAVRGNGHYRRACRRARGLRDPVDVQMPRDGGQVYILTGGSESDGDGGVVALVRGPNGSLRQPARSAGCITQLARSGCARGRALVQPRHMAVSQDGRNVYVATANGAVVVLRRDVGTGRLRQPAGEAGCVISQSAPTSFGCARLPIPDVRPRDVAVAPDGDYVYVLAGGFETGVLQVYDRTPGTGDLRFVGCLSNTVTSQCERATGLRGPRGLAISPDGRTVYVASHYLRDGGTIATFARAAPTGSVVQIDAPAGCWSALPMDGCARGPGWIDPNALVVSHDGKTLYAAHTGGFGGGVLSSWSREDFAGEVHYGSCIAGNIKPCTHARGMRDFSEVSISADGRTLYLGGTTVLGVFRIA